jgi:hypothetical protein
LFDQAGETAVVKLVGYLNGARRPVAMLREDEIRFARSRVIAFTLSMKTALTPQLSTRLATSEQSLVMRAVDWLLMSRGASATSVIRLASLVRS